MFKNIGIVSIVLFFLVSVSTTSFAIAPGAGQAQIKNNMQVMEQNKKRMKEYNQKQQQMIHQQKTQPRQKIDKQIQ